MAGTDRDDVGAALSAKMVTFLEKSVLKLVKDADDLPGLGAGAVVRVDVDPPDGAAGVEDDGGGHRQGDGAVGVDVGQVESEVQLGGAGLAGWAGEDAQAAGDGVAGVGDDGEGQAVLLDRKSVV